MKLENAVAIITGAATGIGRASALLFAREGAKVIVCDVNDVDGEETVRMVKQGGGDAAYIHCDVSNTRDVQQAVSYTVRTCGKLDVLFANAAIRGEGSILDITEELWDRIHAVDLKSVFLCCKYAIPELIKQSKSSIVITSSGGALQSHLVEGYVAPAYFAAKGGVVSFARSIAADYGKYGLRCNVICPGPTMTTEGMKGNAGLDALCKRIPLGRLGQPEEQGKVALFLASEESSFVSGAIIPVDGGMLA